MDKPVLITTGGKVTEIMPKNGRDFSLKEMQDYVGGLIQIVPGEGGKVLFIMNEEGKLMNLPVNSVATMKYPYREHDVLVGNVIITPAKYVK